MKHIKLYETFVENDRYQVISDSVWRTEKFNLGYESFSDREIDQISELVDDFKQKHVRRYNFVSHYKVMYCEYRIIDTSFSIEISKNTDEWFFIKIENNPWNLGFENLIIADLYKMFGPPEDRKFFIKCDGFDSVMNLLSKLMPVVFGGYTK